MCGTVCHYRQRSPGQRHILKFVCGDPQGFLPVQPDKQPPAAQHELVSSPDQHYIHCDHKQVLMPVDTDAGYPDLKCLPEI